MEILRDQYQFIIGLDLIHSIFDRTKAIPLKYLPRVVETNPRTCSTTVTPPVSSIIHTPTASSSSISADAGSGGSPVEEQPIRVLTSTPPELQQQYSTERNRILTSHDIAAAITRNEAITGFCNLPEAVLKLKLDPQLDSPTHLYSRQYPLGKRAIDAAQTIISRWFETGKIVRAL